MLDYGPNDDLFLPDTQTIEPPEPLVTMSIFPNVYCSSAQVVSMPWSDWFTALQQPNIEAIKDKGRLIKMATFGDVRGVPADTEKNPDKSTWSLKHDGNVNDITGVEGDYDKEVMTIATAKALLEKAGIRAIFYSSWGNGVVSKPTQDGKPPKYNGGPRWRVLCPLSKLHKPCQRAALLARVNGVLGGVLAPESFNLSLGYFFGKNPDQPFVCEATFDDPKAGTCVDMLTELDTGAIGRGRETTDDDTLPDGERRAPIDENIFADAVAAKGGLLATGDNRRELLKPYIASRSARGVRADDIGVLVAGIVAKYFDPNDPFDKPNIDAVIADYCNKDERRRAQREAARVIGEGDTFSPLPEVISVDAMLDRFVLLEKGSFVFDTKYPKHTLPLKDFKTATEASFTVVPTGAYDKDGKPKVKAALNAAMWVRSRDKKRAIGATFHAGAGGFVNDPDNKHCVNTWTGFDRTVEGDENSAQIFINHIKWLFKDRADDFLNWLAHIEQRPGQLPHTCWLHIAPNTGMGRNALAGLLARVFTGYTALCVDLEGMLKSGFNDELAGKVLAVVDEIHVGGSNQWADSEKFKQTITAEVRRINNKYGLKTAEHNAARWLIFSNHRTAIPLEDNDRRVEVVTLDADPQPTDYYTRLYGAIEDPKAVAGFARYLQQRDLSGYVHGEHAKRSADKLEVISISRPAMAADLIEFTSNYPCEIVTLDRLKSAAGVFGDGTGGTGFQHAIREAAWEPLKRVRIGTGRARLYVRRQSRAAWAARDVSFAIAALPKMDGGTVDWQDGGTVDWQDGAEDLF